MGLDPNIILQAGQGIQQSNPLQTASQVVGLKNQLIQNQGAQQELAGRIAVGHAIGAHTDQSGNVDWAGVRADLAQNPSGAYLLPQVEQQSLANEKARAELGTAKQQYSQQQLTTAKQFYSGLSDTIVPLLSKRNPDGSFAPISDNDISDAASRLVMSPYISDEQRPAAIQQVQQFIGQLPTDPVGRRQALSELALQALTADKRLDEVYGTMQTDDMGNRKTISNVNRMAGTVTPIASAQIGIPPSDAANTVPYVGPNGQPMTMSKGEYAGQQPQGGFHSDSAPQVPQGGAQAPESPQAPASGPSGGQAPPHLATGLAPGQSEAMTANAQASAQAYNDAMAKSANYRSTKAPLYAEIDNLVKQGTGTGPQAQQSNYIGRMFSQFVNSPGLKSATANSDLLQKDLSQLQQQNVANQGGVATGDKISAAQQATPHQEMSTQGLLLAKAALQGTDQMNDLTVNAYNHYKAAAGQNAMPFNQYAIGLQSQIDPLTLILRSMPKDQEAHYLNSMTPQQRAKIAQSSKDLDTLTKGIGWQP